jgi:hypothetical protein
MKGEKAMNLSYRIFIGLLISFFVSVATVQTSTVGKWRRYVVTLTNSTYSENPFELELNVRFTHTMSGITLMLPGYYAGNDSWKVDFMPTKTGEWTYVTFSSDPDLNGVTGSVTCAESGLPGMLKADPSNPKKWKFTDGNYVVPMAFRMEFFFEPASTSEFTEAADFLKNEVRGHMYETRLLDDKLRYDGRSDYIFEGHWSDHQFDLAIWDRMEERMEILTESGLGAHVMFYSDDAGKPGWRGQSETEALVIRYVVARLAAYPIVCFNTGIDISEYRSQSDINWFGSQIRSLDPYGHPVSSRYGGGSGPYVMSGQSFDSRGFRTAKVNEMTGYFQSSSVPVSMDDAWGENRGSHSSKDHTEHDIRRAFWKCVMAGGVGGLVRGGGDGLPDDGYFSIKTVEGDLESEQWLKLINPFVQTKLGDTFGTMIPTESLVSNAYCIVDPGRTKLLYFTVGQNDRYDANKGGTFTLKLSDLTGDYVASWFDPRSGSETNAGILSGGSDHTVTPPTSDDWVLLLTRQTDATPPTTPQNLNAVPTSEFQIDLNWQAASDPESGISRYKVYRNGTFIGQSSTTSFSDTGLAENSTYVYEVLAVNGAGLESEQSAPVSAATLADTTAPAVVSVTQW